MVLRVNLDCKELKVSKVLVVTGDLAEFLATLGKLETKDHKVTEVKQEDEVCPDLMV